MYFFSLLFIYLFVPHIPFFFFFLSVTMGYNSGIMLQQVSCYQEIKICKVHLISEDGSGGIKELSEGSFH